MTYFLTSRDKFAVRKTREKLAIVLFSVQPVVNQYLFLQGCKLMSWLSARFECDGVAPARPIAYNLYFTCSSRPKNSLTVVTRKRLLLRLYAAEMANIRCKLGFGRMEEQICVFLAIR